MPQDIGGFWHIDVELTDGKASVCNDLSFDQLRIQVLDPWHSSRRFTVSGLLIRSPDDVAHIRIVQTREPMQAFADAHNARMRAARIGDMVTDRRRLPFDDKNGTDRTHELLLAAAQPPQAAPQEAIMSTTTGNKSILFMDVSGWSKLAAVDIKRYVETALPKLKPMLEHADFLNTWGDAIVATFASAKQAAEAALNIRDFFAKATADDGVHEDLFCRISLHQGEILLCNNALTTNHDIFGHAVHVAARLEPATAPRHVFCTDVFARALRDISGLGPKAWHLGPVVLPKKFGEIVASVVTWAKEVDPTPSLQEYVARAEEVKTPINP